MSEGMIAHLARTSETPCQKQSGFWAPLGRPTLRMYSWSQAERAFGSGLSWAQQWAVHKQASLTPYSALFQVAFIVSSSKIEQQEIVQEVLLELDFEADPSITSDGGLSDAVARVLGDELRLNIGGYWCHEGYCLYE